MNKPTIDSTPDTWGGRPETVPPKTTSSRPRSSASTIPQATWIKEAVVRPRERTNPRRSSVSRSPRAVVVEREVAPSSSTA